METVAEFSVSSNWLKWKEWQVKRAEGGHGTEGTYQAIWVFPPSRYPEAAVICYDPLLECGFRVSVSPEVWGSLQRYFPYGGAGRHVLVFSYEGRKAGFAVEERINAFAWSGKGWESTG